MATAGITTSLKKLLLNQLEYGIDSDRYYVALARSNDLDDLVSVKNETLADERTIRNQLHSLKILSKTSMVVPTVEWQSNDTYVAFDDKNNDLTNFYVVNSERDVFVVVQVSKNTDGTSNPSTVEPTRALANNSAQTFKTTDGYHWKHVHSINTGVYGDFKNLTHLPINKLELTNPTLPEDIISTNLQDSAIAGQIIGIAIDSGGTGYSTVPSITIDGNGNGLASFSATINNGSITKVEIDSDDAGNLLHGAGYDYARVTVDAGDAVLRPIIGPKNGMTADPRDTLFAKSVSMKVDFDNNELTTILAENDFRTVVIMKNVKKYNSDSDFAGNTGNALNSFTLGSILPGSTFIEDEILTVAGSGQSAKVFHWDGANTLYYYQNDSTGYGDFTNGLSFTVASGGATITAMNDPDINRYSGEILYINNFAEVARDANQTEDIRLVLELD